MQPVSVSVRNEIGFVLIDNPPVNALHQTVREALVDAINLLQKHKVTAAVLICAGRTFVAGADIKELGQPLKPYLPDVLRLIEGTGFPWVAAIRGTALGGGLELALACDGRIAEKGTKLGLPEVTLGIIPGAGGTVRLPRLVPMRDAIEMVTSGRPIDADRALSIGLVDKVVEVNLEEEAAAFALTLAGSGRRNLRNQDVRTDVDWDSVTAEVIKKARNQNPPLEALNALREATVSSFDEALRKERETFLRLSTSLESEALRHLFFAEKNAGRSLKSLTSESVDLKLVGVIGGGTMGATIATALLLSGSQVRLVERTDEAAALGAQRVADTISASVARNVISETAGNEALGRLSVGSNLEYLNPCPLVIEAVFENIEVKSKLFEDLDRVMPNDAILATNTSYLDVDLIAGQTADPSRVIGLHFFSPAHVMKLLEVVKGKETGDRALATAGALAKRLRKIAVVAGVCEGFIGNRIMAAYRRDCEFMLEEGAFPADIDRAMKAFGFPMGLYEVQDMSGLDMAWSQRKANSAKRSPDTRYSSIADRLCEAGRLGKKVGKGWYNYENGKAEIDPEVTRIIEEESARQGFTRKPFSDHEIMDRILNIMYTEGQKILIEGIAESAADIDVVMASGYGFPRHKGGPMFYVEKF